MKKLFICQEVNGENVFDRLRTTEKTAQDDLEMMKILEPEKRFAIYEEF